jgi:hypothetical protein
MFKLAGILEEPKSANPKKELECSVCCEKGIFMINFDHLKNKS